MEIEQSFTVPYARDPVWACFHDIPGIVACLPGASLTAPPEDGNLKLAMTVKLGPIVASFGGDGAMQLDENAYRGSVTGGGVDRKSASRVKGEAAFALDDSASGETRINVKVDYTISGALAQFSRGGIVKELATRMTAEFAANLKAKLDQAAASATQETPEIVASVNAVATAAATPEVRHEAAPEPLAPPVAVTKPAPVVEAAAPLDLGNLFWKILWSRVRGWLGFGTTPR